MTGAAAMRSAGMPSTIEGITNSGVPLHTIQMLRKDISEAVASCKITIGPDSDRTKYIKGIKEQMGFSNTTMEKGAILMSTQFGSMSGKDFKEMCPHILEKIERDAPLAFFSATTKISQAVSQINMPDLSEIIAMARFSKTGMRIVVFDECTVSFTNSTGNESHIPADIAHIQLGDGNINEFAQYITRFEGGAKEYIKELKGMLRDFGVRSGQQGSEPEFRDMKVDFLKFCRTREELLNGGAKDDNGAGRVLDMFLKEGVGEDIKIRGITAAAQMLCRDKMAMGLDTLIYASLTSKPGRLHLGVPFARMWQHGVALTYIGNGDPFIEVVPEQEIAEGLKNLKPGVINAYSVVDETGCMLTYMLAMGSRSDEEIRCIISSAVKNTITKPIKKRMSVNGGSILRRILDEMEVSKVC